MVNNWVIQDPQGTVYILQEDPSSYVYALNGEQVFALNGSPIQFGLFWTSQTNENSGWINQT